jgi:hypothetical protein
MYSARARRTTLSIGPVDAAGGSGAAETQGRNDAGTWFVGTRSERER